MRFLGEEQSTLPAVEKEMELLKTYQQITK